MMTVQRVLHRFVGRYEVSTSYGGRSFARSQKPADSRIVERD